MVQVVRTTAVNVDGSVLREMANTALFLNIEDSTRPAAGFTDLRNDRDFRTKQCPA